MPNDPSKKRMFKRKSGKAHRSLRTSRLKHYKRIVNERAKKIIAEEKLVDKIFPEINAYFSRYRSHKMTRRESYVGVMFTIEQSIIGVLVKDPAKRKLVEERHSKLLRGKLLMAELDDNGFTTLKQLNGIISDAIEVGPALFKTHSQVNEKFLGKLRDILNGSKDLPPEEVIEIRANDPVVSCAMDILKHGFNLSLGKAQNIALFWAMEKILTSKVSRNAF